jgi:hypothetical protein
MNAGRLLAVVGGSLVGLALGVVGAAAGWNWLTSASKEDFTAGLVALLIGAPVGTAVGALLAGFLFDRLFPPAPKG